MAKTNKKSESKSTNKSNPLYSIYGARLSKSGERINISILKGKDDDIEWGTISLPKTGSRNVKVKYNDLEVRLYIPRVDIADDEDDDEED